MGLIRKKVTPEVIAANRANSKKSTGPRSPVGKLRVARNAGKYFVFGQISPSRMKELGEDPAEFGRLRQSLRGALDPQDGLEEMLVEEMTVNRWRLGRLRRAETGLLAVQQLQLEHKRKLAFGKRGVSWDNLMIKSFGLTGVSDSREKFIQILDLLENVRAGLEGDGFTPQGLALLRRVYGESPAVVGMGLTKRYGAQLESAESNLPAVDNEERVGAQDSFLEDLNREIAVFAQEAEALVLAQNMPLPESIKDSQLIPSREDAERILRYETMLQRDFERSMKEFLDWRNRKRQTSHS